MLKAQGMTYRTTRFFPQVPLSRKFRSLKLWMTMRAFGLDKVRGHIRRHTQLAKDLEAMVKTDDR